MELTRRRRVAGRAEHVVRIVEPASADTDDGNALGCERDVVSDTKLENMRLNFQPRISSIYILVCYTLHKHPCTYTI